MRSAALCVALVLLLAACSRETDPFAAPPRTPLAPLETADALIVLHEGGEGVPTLLERITAAGDHRFVAVLIELLRASQIGLRESPHYNAEVVALERLSGQAYGSDWIRWTSWYAGTGLSAPPGFSDLKARILASIDPALGAFFEGDPPGDARPLEIVWDGNAPEPLRDPPERAWLSGEGASRVDPREAVLGVVLAGSAVAYPIRLLEGSPVHNDAIGGAPVLVVWCSLCGSGSVWSAARGEGRRRFALSGLVHRSVPLLYDEATRTLWDALTGRAVFGAEAKGGTGLEPIPVVVTTWEAWRARHPESLVLESPRGRPSPYARYLVSDETVFPTLELPGTLAPKEQVFGLELGLQSRAWGLDALLEVGVQTDRLAGRAVQVVATRPRVLMRVAPDPNAPPWSPGAEVRAYQGPDLELVRGPDPDILVDPDGQPWKVTEAALLGPGGARAPRLPGTLAYRFAWHATRN